jgi:hypothetical protein
MICDYDDCLNSTDEAFAQWPNCRECGYSCCPEHQAPGTKTHADVDQPETCLCVGCQAVDLMTEDE